MNIDQLYKNQLNFIESKRSISVEDRLKYLKNLKKEIVINEDNIYNALDLDLKKPRFETYATEIGFLLNEIDLFLKKIKILGKTSFCHPCPNEFPV